MEMCVFAKYVLHVKSFSSIVTSIMCARYYVQKEHTLHLIGVLWNNLLTE